MKEKTAKKSKAIYFAWPTLTVSIGVGAALLGYVTYFATDFMGIPAAVAGVIFMISKIFDGFTDLVAGYLIERTRSRLGKGRPWQLAIIGYWISGVLMFAAPQMGATASYIYLFVMYSLVNSVFLTMINCADVVYLANAIEDQKQSISVLSVNGFVTMVCSTAAAIIFPQIIKNLSTRQDWTTVVLIVAIPCTLIGLIRFFVVKEKAERSNANADTKPIGIKEMVKLLVQNKYALLFAVILLIANIGTSLGQNVGTYYALYVFGDIGVGSILSLSMVSILIAIAITPGISKKIGFVKTMRIFTLIGVVGFLIRLIDVHNLLLMFVASMLSMIGFYVVFMYAGTFGLECIDYGEYKFGVRSEGTIGAVQSFTGKIGTALGAGLVGVLMGIGGYNGALEVQPDSAVTMIVLINSVFPAVFCVIVYFMLRKYDLEGQMGDIRAALEAKRNANND